MRKLQSGRRIRLRQGYTLADLLTSIALVGIFMAVLLPALGVARERNRSSDCKNNLRQFFVGMMQFAENDPATRLSSGAHDGRRDGCIDSFGWVADMVNKAGVMPQELLCPANPGRGSKTLNDYIGTAKMNANESAGDARLISGIGACNMFNGGDSSSGTVTMTGVDVAEHFLAKGYGTNYAQSWFAARTGPREEIINNVLTQYGATAVSAHKRIQGLRGALGPLTRVTLDEAYPSSSRIPLLFDASSGKAQEAACEQEAPGYIAKGNRLVESFSDGPHLQQAAVGRLMIWGEVVLGGSPICQVVAIRDVNNGVNLLQTEQPPAGVAFDDPALNPSRVAAADINGNRVYVLPHLQDWRDIGPVHGMENSLSANVLMSDGSVREFTDQTGDGYLNPGFDVATNNKTQADFAGTGYADNRVELPEAEIFSGVFLRKWSDRKTIDP